MNRLLFVSVVVALVVILVGGCDDAPFSATFTSRIVQLDTCKTVGTAPEGCSKAEIVSEVQNDLVEADDDAFWLYGVPRDGKDIALLGSRDTLGGFLFVDETVQSDSNSGCVLTSTLQLSLSIEEGRDGDVGSNDCVSLVGREVETVATSAECDDTSVPPQPIERVTRRRWEPLDAASTCGQ